MTSFNEDFPFRVNYAAQCIMRGITSRRRNSCYENNDGDLVVVALVRRARKNPKLHAAIAKEWGGTFPQHWYDLAEKYENTHTRDLPVLARKMREEAEVAWEKQKQARVERDRQASADQAPLPSQDNISS